MPRRDKQTETPTRPILQLHDMDVASIKSTEITMKGGKSWDGGGRGNVSARRAYICDERRSKQIRISTLAHGTTLLISIEGQVVVERRRHCSKNIGLRHRSSGFHPSRRLHTAQHPHQQQQQRRRLAERQSSRHRSRRVVVGVSSAEMGRGGREDGER